jgi:hypothetical protein
MEAPFQWGCFAAADPRGCSAPSAIALAPLQTVGDVAREAMSKGTRETNTTATRTAKMHDDPGLPIATWIISGVALIVALTAGALVLSPRPENAAPQADEQVQPDTSIPPTDALNKPLERNPLEITASFLDAQQRSRLWDPTSALSGIELVVKDGKPTGPIVFEFGETIGHNVPGAVLSEKRYTISYEEGKVETATTASAARRVALPEPNCPLEVAFSTLIRSGVETQGRFGVLYVQSQKHGRPVWLITNEAGEATSLNADNCALLRR